MGLRDAILPEYDHETAVTRRLLACVPSHHREWRPHPRSMSLGTLAAHLADIPRWVPTVVRESGYDMAAKPDHPGPPAHPDTAALLSAFDRHAAAGREIVATAEDADLLASWRLASGERTLLDLTRLQALRRYVLSHLVHHRGQLTVYLRQLGVRLPSVCGPSGD
jgi:uncharacterized damage-inducible protein DinB